MLLLIINVGIKLFIKHDRQTPQGNRTTILSMEHGIKKKLLTELQSPCQSQLTAFSNEFLFTMLFCRFFFFFLLRYNLVPFSAFFSRPPTASNSFFIRLHKLLWQYWVLGLWAQQLPFSHILPSPCTYITSV